MLAQSKEIDRLRDELAKANEKLENQEIKLANAGSIAEASLSLTKAFEESRRAADLYFKNGKQMNGEAEYEKG
nr:DNA repair protein [Streptococcus lutetiensis]